MSPLKSTFGAASSFGWLPRTTFTPLTGVEYSIWSGGYGSSTPGPGGSVTKRTNMTLGLTGSYSVVVGAAGSDSGMSPPGGSYEMASVSSTSSRNTVNGTATIYSTFGTNVQRNAWTRQLTNGPYGYAWYENGNQISVQGSAPGAGSNGYSASINFPYSYGSASGGDGFSVTASGLSGFPQGSVGFGGTGDASPGSDFIDVYQYPSGYYWSTINWYASYGSIGVSGANTGNGAGTGSSYTAAGSGGFTLRYSDTQLPLSATTGTVVYLKSGGYHNYFWKSTGSFTI